MHWALSKRIQIVVAFSAITLVAIFLLLPADTDVQTTKTSAIHDAIIWREYRHILGTVEIC